MNCELWIAVHSLLIAGVTASSLYAVLSQVRRENLMWKRILKMQLEILNLRTEVDVLNVKVAVLEKKLEEKK